VSIPAVTVASANLTLGEQPSASVQVGMNQITIGSTPDSGIGIQASIVNPVSTSIEPIAYIGTGIKDGGIAVSAGTTTVDTSIAYKPASIEGGNINLGSVEFSYQDTAKDITPTVFAVTPQVGVSGINVVTTVSKDNIVETGSIGTAGIIVSTDVEGATVASFSITPEISWSGINLVKTEIAGDTVNTVSIGTSGYHSRDDKLAENRSRQ